MLQRRCQTKENSGDEGYNEREEKHPRIQGGLL